jgi:hypothetical protein
MELNLNRNLNIGPLGLRDERAGPRDDKGHFVPRGCPRPNCGNGNLQYEGNGFWMCDGLAAPDDEGELDCCTFSHEDGKPYNPKG